MDKDYILLKPYGKKDLEYLDTSTKSICIRVTIDTLDRTSININILINAWSGLGWYTAECQPTLNGVSTKIAWL